MCWAKTKVSFFYIILITYTIFDSINNHYFHRLLKVYKKIHKFSNVLKFFCTNDWIVANDNVQLLWKKLNKTDQELFHFNMKDLDWSEYLFNYIPGMRRTLFKDNDSTLEAARQKWRRFYWLHQLVKLILSFLILYFFWTMFSGFF